MPQTFEDIDQTTHTVSQCITKLDDRSESQRASFSGTSAPTSPTPVDGQLYYDETNDILYYRRNGAWVAIAQYVEADQEFQKKQAKNFRIENLGADVTPAADRVGQVYLLTGTKKARVVVDSSTLETIVSIKGADYISKELPLGAWVKDATNPPTDATKGTTPTCRGWLMDAANELASANVRVPQGYADTGDLKLRVYYVLNQLEDAGNDVDFTLDWRSVQPGNNEIVSGTSSTRAETSDMGSSILEGACNFIDITIDFDDATNPVHPGDYLVLEIHRTNLAEVGGVIFLGAELLIPAGSKLTE